MAMNLLFWDKNKEIGLAGTGARARLFGRMHPSYNSMHDQFIVPHPHSTRGFIFKDNTYIKLLLPNEGGEYDHLVFGSDNDIVIDFAERLLDVGVAFQAGRDYYIYLCHKAPEGTQKTATSDLVISLNSTFPQGYNRDNSRKIGGFHTLCLAVPDNAANADSALRGYNTADILPSTFWDLGHRCGGFFQEGTLYDPRMQVWSFIYMQSGSGANTRSIFGGTVTKSQVFAQHVEDLMLVGFQPLQDEEFSSLAEGSNQRTAIQGAADPITTGGRVDTAGRRMTSDLGAEDCCGAYWQWLAGWSFGNTAGPVADGTKGGVWNTNALLAGGSWSSGTSCGSRARHANHSRLSVTTNGGCRGRARSRASR